MRLIFLGAPGSGKTTHAKRLASELLLPYIGTGEMLLEGIAESTELGQHSQPFVEQGKLVPDPVMITFIRERLQSEDTQRGWILDGYPRTSFQAEELDFMFNQVQQRVDSAIWLDASETVLMARSRQRDRLDDTPQALQERVSVFRQATIPLTEYYAMQNKLVTIKADEEIEKVYEEIRRHISA